MTGSRNLKLALALGIVVLTAPLGGCAYDYLQHTDRVAYSSGDAVKANIAAQTTNPSKGSTYSTKGLGKDGNVIPDPAAAAE